MISYGEFLAPLPTPFLLSATNYSIYL